MWDSNFYGDAADRARLQAMSELQREMELDRRREVRRKLQERAEAQRRLEKSGGEGPVRSGKVDLRAERDARFAHYLEREKAQLRGLGEDEEDDEEDAEEGEVGDEPADEDVEQRRERLDVGSPVPLSEVIKIQGRRSVLIGWQERPQFEKTVMGLYVKVRVGDSNGQGVYRMARVDQVERRPTFYKLVGEAMEKSNVHLLCSIGRATKRFKLVQVSNQDLDSKEFTLYVRKQSEDQLPPPGDREVKRKLRDLEEAKNYKRSEEELEEMLRLSRSKPLEEMSLVQLKDRRTELEGLLREAKDNKDRDQMVVLTRDLRRLRELLEEKEPLQQSRLASAGSRYNERVKKRRMDSKEAAEYYAEDDPTKANPFRRRRTVSSAMIVKKSKVEGPEEEEKQEEPAPQEQQPRQPEQEQEQAAVDEDVASLQRTNVVVKRLGKSPKQLAADMAAQHEFELDIDI